MPNVVVRFTTRWPWNVGSWAVARLSGSRDWSHCMLIADGRVFEASMTHGCRECSIADAMHGVSAYQDMPVSVSDLSNMLLFGRQQAGKGYDWMGAAGIPLLHSEDWSDDRRWWCSELAFVMLGVGGTWLLDPAERTRVTPGDLHQVNLPKNPIIKPASAGFF